MAKGFTAEVNYTWSHAIDDGNEQGASWNISNSYNNALFNGNYPLDKGSSTLDQRHRLSINWLWKPVLTSSNSGFARYFVNGWELSAVTTLASAHPISATINSLSTSTGAEIAGISLNHGTLNGSGGSNRVPFWPVNSMNIDQIYNVDARIHVVNLVDVHAVHRPEGNAVRAARTIERAVVQADSRNLGARGRAERVDRRRNRVRARQRGDRRE